MIAGISSVFCSHNHPFNRQITAADTWFVRFLSARAELQKFSLRSCHGMSRPVGRNRGNDDNKSIGIDSGPDSASSSARNYKPEKQLELESRDNRNQVKKEETRDTGPAIESIKREGFNVVKVLGKGSYSIVYKVSRIVPIDGKANEQAVKTIYMDDNLSDNYKTKFLPQELKTLMTIKHENIIVVYQIILMRFNAGYLIFMEYASGGTLSDLIVKRGAQTEKMAKSLFSDIFRAMGYMHSVPFAHRDMKLENILLDKNGRPKITDFSYGVYCGSANHELVLSKTFCGTTPYMPPEMLQQKPYSPLLADVWSLGVCLYIFVNASFPFKISDDPDMMVKLQLLSEMNMKSKYEAALSPEIKDLIKCMLQTDSSKRITMNNVLFHPWIKAVVVQKNKTSSPRRK